MQVPSFDTEESSKDKPQQTIIHPKVYVESCNVEFFIEKYKQVTKLTHIL